MHTFRTNNSFLSVFGLSYKKKKRNRKGRGGNGREGKGKEGIKEFLVMESILSSLCTI